MSPTDASPPSRAVTLCKFGQRAHIESFLSGKLYMNSLRHFAHLEAGMEDYPRSDRYEGALGLWQANGATLSIRGDGGEWLKIGTLTAPIIKIHEQPELVKVFCMYAIYQPACEPLVHVRNRSFGDTFAILTQPDSFLERLKAVCVRQGIKANMQPVEYFDENTYEGPLDAFKKRTSFSYQAEFRIVIERDAPGPFELDIGDISDIVFVGPFDELNDRLMVNYPSSDLVDSPGGEPAG